MGKAVPSCGRDDYWPLKVLIKSFRPQLENHGHHHPPTQLWHAGNDSMWKKQWNLHTRGLVNNTLTYSKLVGTKKILFQWFIWSGGCKDPFPAVPKVGCESWYLDNLQKLVGTRLGAQTVKKKWSMWTCEFNGWKAILPAGDVALARAIDQYRLGHRRVRSNYERMV